MYALGVAAVAAVLVVIFVLVLGSGDDDSDLCEGVVCHAATGQCKVAGTCQPSSGKCSTESNSAYGTSCDDGDSGTSRDICTAGVCAGTASPPGGGGSHVGGVASPPGGGGSHVGQGLCSEIPTFAGGSVNYSISPTGEGSTATYSCTDPLIISGSTVRTCQADGSWTETEPSCISEQHDATSCPELTFGAGIVSYENPDRRIGTVATYTCTENDPLIPTPVPRTCQANGSWDGVEPTCCPEPDTFGDSAGTVIYSTDQYSHDRFARYSCEDGTPDVDMRICHNGYWEASHGQRGEPTCGAPCSHLVYNYVLENGKIVEDNNESGDTSGGGTATYSCNEGSWLHACVPKSDFNELPLTIAENDDQFIGTETDIQNMFETCNNSIDDQNNYSSRLSACTGTQWTYTATNSQGGTEVEHGNCVYEPLFNNNHNIEKTCTSDGVWVSRLGPESPPPNRPVFPDIPNLKMYCEPESEAGELDDRGGCPSDESLPAEIEVTKTMGNAEGSKAYYWCGNMPADPPSKTCTGGKWELDSGSTDTLPSCTHIIEPVCGWMNRIWHEPKIGDNIPSQWGTPETTNYKVHEFIERSDDIPGVGGQCKGLHGTAATFPEEYCWPRKDPFYTTNMRDAEHQRVFANLRQWMSENPGKNPMNVDLSLLGACDRDAVATMPGSGSDVQQECARVGARWNPGSCSEQMANGGEATTPDECTGVWSPAFCDNLPPRQIIDPQECTAVGGNWSPGTTFPGGIAIAETQRRLGWCAPCPPNTELDHEEKQCVPCGHNRYRGNNHWSTGTHRPENDVLSSADHQCTTGNCMASCITCPEGYADNSSRPTFDEIYDLSSSTMRTGLSLEGTLLQITQYPEDLTSHHLKRWTCGSRGDSELSHTDSITATGVTKVPDQMCQGGYRRPSAGGECEYISDTNGYRPKYYDNVISCDTGAHPGTYDHKICVNCAELHEDDDHDDSSTGDKDPQTRNNSIWCARECAMMPNGCSVGTGSDHPSNGFYVYVDDSASMFATATYNNSYNVGWGSGENSRSGDVGGGPTNIGSPTTDCGCVAGDTQCSVNPETCKQFGSI